MYVAFAVCKQFLTEKLIHKLFSYAIFRKYSLKAIAYQLLITTSVACLPRSVGNQQYIIQNNVEHVTEVGKLEQKA